MTYEKTKNIKRYSFGISRNPTSHQAGSNTVTIATRSDYQSFDYSTPSVGLTMTVKEARALQKFLNSEFPMVSDSSSVVG